ncbi:MAG TPA: hypothetical protein VIH57_10790 [Bacteroidales bacterium]
MNAKILSALLFAWVIICPEISIKAQQMDSIHNERTIFSDNFTYDVTGKFPKNWISNRPGEVITLKSLPGKWFKMHSEGTYLPAIKQDFPKHFTVTFNLIHQSVTSGNNTVEFTIYNKLNGSVNDALFPGSSGVKIIFETFIVSCLCYDNLNPNGQVTAENRQNLIKANNMAKISIQVDQQQLKVFVDGTECLNVPNCNKGEEPLNAVRFYLWGSMAEPVVGDFKITQD